MPGPPPLPLLERACSIVTLQKRQNNFSLDKTWGGKKLNYRLLIVKMQCKIDSHAHLCVGWFKNKSGQNIKQKAGWVRDPISDLMSVDTVWKVSGCCHHKCQLVRKQIKHALSQQEKWPPQKTTAMFGWCNVRRHFSHPLNFPWHQHLWTFTNMMAAYQIFSLLLAMWNEEMLINSENANVKLVTNYVIKSSFFLFFNK